RQASLMQRATVASHSDYEMYCPSMLPILVKALLRELANVVMPAVAAKATRATISTYSTSPWPVSSVRSATREFLSFCIIDVPPKVKRRGSAFANFLHRLANRTFCSFTGLLFVISQYGSRFC